MLHCGKSKISCAFLNSQLVACQAKDVVLAVGTEVVSDLSPAFCELVLQDVHLSEMLLRILFFAPEVTLSII